MPRSGFFSLAWSESQLKKIRKSLMATQNAQKKKKKKKKIVGRNFLKFLNVY